MAKCRQCGKEFMYNDLTGYAADICSSFCDGALSQHGKIAALTAERDRLAGEVERLKARVVELEAKYEPYEETEEQRVDHRLDRDGVLIVPGDELELLDDLGSRGASMHVGQIVECVGYKNGEIETNVSTLSWKGSRFRIVVPRKAAAEAGKGEG